MISKFKEYFFIRFMTSRINYSLLFMLIKINVQKETSFSHTKPRAFSQALHFENLKKKKGSLHNVFSPKTSLPNTRAIISFPRKKITKELQDFKSKLF